MESSFFTHKNLLKRLVRPIIDIPLWLSMRWQGKPSLIQGLLSFVWSVLYLLSPDHISSLVHTPLLLINIGFFLVSPPTTNHQPPPILCHAPRDSFYWVSGFGSLVMMWWQRNIYTHQFASLIFNSRTVELCTVRPICTSPYYYGPDNGKWQIQIPGTIFSSTWVFWRVQPLPPNTGALSDLCERLISVLRSSGKTCWHCSCSAGEQFHSGLDKFWLV